MRAEQEEKQTTYLRVRERMSPSLSKRTSLLVLLLILVAGSGVPVATAGDDSHAGTRSAHDEELAPDHDAGGSEALKETTQTFQRVAERERRLASGFSGDPWLVRTAQPGWTETSADRHVCSSAHSSPLFILHEALLI